MHRAFADTLYWVAIIKLNDPYQAAAIAAKGALGDCLLVTTDEVLSEFLTAFSGGGPLLREKAAKTVRAIMSNPNVKVLAQSRDTFLKALDRYSSRLDKSYSFVDCASMNVMDAEGLSDALTNDHHFEQEGYNVLIRLS